MKITHDNFIGIYEDAFSPEYCDRIIQYFDYMQKAGFAENRQQAENITKLNKDDSAIFAHYEQVINAGSMGEAAAFFNSVFWNSCYSDYADTYSVLKEAAAHKSYNFKIQKTEIGGGYHMWHFESDSRANSPRLLVWMLYLNDVEEGGETEFLYYHKRIKPKAGTLLIWPTGYTHTHRGNPPISNSKYVITGWIEF